MNYQGYRFIVENK